MVGDQSQMFNIETRGVEFVVSPTDKQDRQCWLCGNIASSFYDSPARAHLCLSCETCGTYFVIPSFKSASASYDSEYHWSDDQKATLSAYCRRNLGTWISIGPGDIERLCAFVPRYSPPERIDRLLQILGERTSKIGKPAQFNVVADYPLIVANGWEEAHFILGALIQKRFIDADKVEEKNFTELMAHRANLARMYDKSPMASGPVPRGPEYTVTMDGWIRIEEIKTSGRSLTQCFVAMAFRKATDFIWESVIEPAIREAGYKPFRIDREQHVNRIDDEIISQIRRSRFMVADFTLQRGGVYFEAGMMHGLGRNVIWMCHQDELTSDKGLHFDIRQFNFLTYQAGDEETKKRLYERIVAVEGEGPLLKSEAESR
jgi:hypothetical protein